MTRPQKRTTRTTSLRAGDIARRKGGCYFFLGRASLDIIKTGEFKISALDVERYCLALSYVEEVVVVDLEDEKFGQRVAPLVSVNRGSSSNA